MSKRFLCCVGSVALLSGSAIAASAYQQALGTLDLAAVNFVSAQEYQAVEPELLTGDDYYSTKNFPDKGQGAMSLPDADLDAITRSMLLVEAQEKPLPHARYRVTYSLNVSDEVPELEQAYVEVTRYNLGPTLRDDLSQSVPAEHLASPAEFGIAPHVSWRFALAPVMGTRFGLVYASRKEVPASQAQVADCLGEPCLSLADPAGPAGTWGQIESPQLEQAAYTSRTSLGLTRPARVLQELWAGISTDGMDILPYQPGKAQFEFVVSWNIAGQEAAVSALARQADVMDTSIAEIWTMRNEIAEVLVEFSRMHLARASTGQAKR